MVCRLAAAPCTLRAAPSKATTHAARRGFGQGMPCRSASHVNSYPAEPPGCRVRWRANAHSSTRSRVVPVPMPGLGIHGGVVGITPHNASPGRPQARLSLAGAEPKPYSVRPTPSHPLAGITMPAPSPIELPLFVPLYNESGNPPGLGARARRRGVPADDGRRGRPLSQQDVGAGNEG